MDIPENQYMGQGQIILVESTGRLIKAFCSQYSALGCMGDIKSIGFLENCGDEMRVISASGESFAIRNLTNSNLQSGRVVGLNAGNEVVKQFRLMKFTADFFLKSALIREQKVYLVEKAFESGILAKDINRNVTEFIEADFCSEIIEHGLVFVKNGKLVMNMQHPHFYTGSKLYGNAEFGSVVIEAAGDFF